MNRRFLLPMIIMFLFFVVMCTEALAGSRNRKEDIGIPAVSVSSELTEDKELNQSEKVILNLFDPQVSSQESSRSAEEGGFGTYVKYLHNYLSSPGIDLASSKAYTALNKIFELEAIMNIEQESSINRMSVDGRELALRLSREIYGICGLELSYDLKGNITRISDKATDNLIYLNPETARHTVRYAGFRLDILMVTLAILMVLFCICVMIAKKNQLFQKEAVYDGFKEEGFVQ